MSVPNSCTNLNKAIKKYVGVGGDDLRLARAMANVVLGQMLPPGVVKGGSSLMFRYGGAVTRYTRDVDTARVADLDAYVAELERRLATGWCGFTGKLVRVEPATPPSIPPVYLMMPFDVKFNYNKKPWMTIRIEVGHNEIGDADEAEWGLPQDVAAAFVALGFPVPEKIQVMKLSHQIAQKLHAVSEPGSARAHDLIDLQLIFNNSEINLVETRCVCERLFSYRKKQSWPPKIVKSDGWNDLYLGAKGDLSVLQTADDAVVWVNDLVQRIANGAC